MRLFKHFKNAVLYPSLFLLIFVTSYSIFENYNESRFSLFTPIISALIYFLVTIVLSSTMFLNKIKKVRKNLIWNILSWFLLPFLYILLIWINYLENIFHFEFGIGRGFVYLLIMTLPFVITLCWTFITTRKSLSHEN